MIDAFVAMGGNEDTSGNVDAELLIRIIKNEFELTIDIEGLIKEVDTDGSGVIEFGEFKELLKTNYL
jgi:Ca2+-binding EF-hand superfamily protein